MLPASGMPFKFLLATLFVLLTMAPSIHGTGAKVDMEPNKTKALNNLFGPTDFDFDKQERHRVDTFFISKVDQDLPKWDEMFFVTCGAELGVILVTFVIVLPYDRWTMKWKETMYYKAVLHVTQRMSRSI